MTRAGRGAGKGGREGEPRPSTPTPSGADRLSADLVWINECFPLSDDLHEHVSVYLLEGADARVVVDSGSFYHRESIERRLKEATDDEGPDAIVLSHSDYPHAGNIGAFRQEWGDIDIVASSGAPEIQGLPYATRCTVGGSMDVRGRRMSFLDPPLADRSHTTWVHDHAAGALFTSDGFGNVHAPGQCAWRYGDFPDGIPAEDIGRYHRTSLSWLRYVDPPRLEESVRAVFDDFDVEWICPVHGNPIGRDDVGAYLERLFASVVEIAAAHPGPGA